MIIQLKFISKTFEQKEDSGTGSNEVVKEEFECPCAEGKVIYEEDKNESFKNANIYCSCEKCKELYYFTRGLAKEREI